MDQLSITGKVSIRVPRLNQGAFPRYYTKTKQKDIQVFLNGGERKTYL